MREQAPTQIYLKLLCTEAVKFQPCRDQGARSPLTHPQSPHNYFIPHSYLCFHIAALYELEREPAYWDAQAKATLDAALKLRPREHQAKNLILFLGDGRSCYHCEIYSSRHSTWRWLGWKIQRQWQTQLNIPCMTVLKCPVLNVHRMDRGEVVWRADRNWWCRCVSTFRQSRWTSGCSKAFHG